MSYKITWDRILSEFEFEYPELAKKVIDSYPSGQMELTVKLDDGVKIAYDYLMKTVRTVYDPKDESDHIPEDDYRKSFAAKLYKKMRVNGMSQEELADMVGVSRVSMSSYMNGHSMPNIYILTKLAKALKCTITELGEVR